MNPIILIGAGALILFIGVGLGYWFGNTGRKQETEKAGEIKAELDDYRRQVSEHFSATAGHFEAIGDEYRKLYAHMASGAGALCAPGQSGQAVSFAPVELLSAGPESVDEASPPRDYDLAEQSADETEIAALADDEPSDDELAVTESAEELLAEAELATEAVEAEKTLH